MITDIGGRLFRTYPDGKDFPFDPGDPQSRLDAAAAAEAHVAARRRAIEKKARRPLTDSEYYGGEVQHSDSRDLLTREREARFEPVRKQAGRYDKLKADILQKMEEKRVSAMSSLERQLYDVERMEQQDAEQIAEQNAKEAHLMNPRVHKALEELHELENSIRWDDSRDAGELVKVRNAIKQWEAHDADTEVAETMLREVLDHEDARTQAIDNAKREQIRQIEATLAPERKPRKVQVDRTLPIRE